MEPYGAEQPLIYVLGEHPGETDDERGEQFMGEAGKLLRSQFKSAVFRRDVRLGNTIQCRPIDAQGGHKLPEMSEIECCRHRVADDIAMSSPIVVVGAGGIPLNWATGLSGINGWRGKLIATRIGGLDCWYYPILSPDFVLRKQRAYGKSEFELCFEHDIEWVLDNVEKLPNAITYKAPYDTGITLIEGQGLEDYNRLEGMLSVLSSEPYVAIDLETSGLRPYMDNPKIHLCAIGTYESTVAFPLDHPQGWSDNFRRRVWSLLADFILSSGAKIAHHLSFELEWLTYFYGRKIAHLTEWEDTMAQAHTLDERIGTLSLDDLTRQHFGFFLKKQSNVDPKRLLEYPIRDTLRYNGMDTKWTALLHTVQKPQIDANPQYVIEYERKLRLAPALVFTQQKGIPVDFDYTRKMQAKLQNELEEIEIRLGGCREIDTYQARYGHFSPMSPADVLKLMKDVCKRDEVNKSGGGHTSDEEALSKIPAKEVPSAPMILEHRSVSKLLGTYITPLLDGQNVYSDGHIHCTFGSMIAVTGRLNSSDPNMQNFPKN